MAIVKDIEAVNEVITVHSDLDFKTLEPFVYDIEQKYILPIIGETLYEVLSADEMFDDEEQALIEQITKPVVTLAFNASIPYMNVGISGSGGLVVGGGEHERPASQTRTEDLKRATLNDGHNRIDQLMRFIEKNIADYDIDLTAIYGEVSHFLPTSKSISKFVPLEENRFVFMKMVPVLHEIERSVLTEVLGETLYIEVFDSFESEGGLDSSYETLVALCAPVLSHLTFAEALLAIGLSVDDRGITIFNTNYAETVDVRLPAGANDVSALKNRHNTLGSKAIGKLVDYLNANTDTFTAFTESKKYVANVVADDSTFSVESPGGNIVL